METQYVQYAPVSTKTDMNKTKVLDELLAYEIGYRLNSNALYSKSGRQHFKIVANSLVWADKFFNSVEYAQDLINKLDSIDCNTESIIEEFLNKSCLRGYLDANVEIQPLAINISIPQTIQTRAILDKLLALYKIELSYITTQEVKPLSLTDYAVVEMLMDVYEDCIVFNTNNRDQIKKLFVQGACSVQLDASAVMPIKAHPSDSGYDLTLISVAKTYGNTVLYDTGVHVAPAYPYYFEIVPRSSISKTGYMLANSVGVIDGSYRGSIKVALIKVDANMPDLTLPAQLCQMIPRKFAHLELTASNSKLTETDRNDGGFGSTNLAK